MIKQRALKATLWSGLDVLLRRGVGFIVSIVLARLIAPEQFGVIALLYLFVGLAGAFIDSGFSAALVQKHDASHTDESTVFWFNLFLGALTALLLCAAATPISRFFDQPILVPLTWILAADLFVGSLGSIHNTLLTKQLNFRLLMKIGVTATIISGAAAIALAAAGYGVWALAWQTLVATSCTTLMLWWWHPWRPARTFSRQSVRSLFGFGGYLLASALLDTGFSRLYTVLIGKLFGVRELGYYNRADSTQQMPAGLLSGILSRVAFPIFSAASTDNALLRRGVRLSVRGILLLNAPAMFGLAAVAHPLVLTLFGARWEPAVRILRVLCIAGVLWPLHVINLNVLMAQGHSNLFFRLEVIKKSVGIAFLILGATQGVMGVAWAMVAFSLVAFFINAYYTGHYLDYSSFAQLRDVLPIVTVSIVMGLVVHGIGTLWRPSPPIALAAQVMAGVAFMAIVVPLLRLTALQDAINLFRRVNRLPAGGV